MEKVAGIADVSWRSHALEFRPAVPMSVTFSGRFMRRLRAIVNLVAIVLIVLATMRLWARPTAVPPAAIDPSSILDRRVAPLEFHDLAFDDAVERLGRAAGVEIVIDTTAPVMQTVLSTENVSLTTWNGMTLGSALAALLPPSGQSEMRFFVDRGRVRITMWPQIPVVTRIYDVHDLWQLAIDEVPPDFDQPKMEHSGISGGVIGLSPPATLPSVTTNRKDAIKAEALKRIGNLVMFSLPGYEEYNVNGGRAADLQAVDGRLIVTQTAEGHRRIAELLQLIRQMQASPVDGRPN